MPSKTKRQQIIDAIAKAGGLVTSIEYYHHTPNQLGGSDGGWHIFGEVESDGSSFGFICWDAKEALDKITSTPIQEW